MWCYIIMRAHGVQSAEVLDWLKEACQTVVADEGFEGASTADWAQVLPPTLSLCCLHASISVTFVEWRWVSLVTSTSSAVTEK